MSKDSSKESVCGFISLVAISDVEERKIVSFLSLNTFKTKSEDLEFRTTIIPS